MKHVVLVDKAGAVGDTGATGSRQVVADVGLVGRRARSIVLVASPDHALADRLVADVARSGAVACRARSAAGCLRVATAVGPDLVLLDASLSRRLEGMLQSHPATAATAIVRVSPATVCAGAPTAPMRSSTTSRPRS